MSHTHEGVDTLLLEIQNDNHFAFSRLFDLYKGKVYSFAKKLVLTEADADEVTQRVFIKLWEKRKKIIINTSLDAFLYVLTKNTCLDFLRKIGNDKKLLNNFIRVYSSSENHIEDILYYNELLSQAETVIDLLPQKQKEVYVLAKIENKSYEEIAQTMNISKNTVKTQLKIASSFVKKNLDKISKSLHTALLTFIF